MIAGEAKRGEAGFGPVCSHRQIAGGVRPDEAAPFRAAPPTSPRDAQLPEMKGWSGSFRRGGPLRGAQSAESSSLQKIQNGIENVR